MATLSKESLLRMVKTAVQEANEPLKERIVELEGKSKPSTIRVDPKNVGGFPHFNRGKDKHDMPLDQFSIVRAIAAISSKDFSRAGFERDAIKASEQKALSWASGSGGGYWIAEEFLGDSFIEALAAKTIVRRAGVTVLPCTNAPVLIPKISSGAIAYWVQQNATINASDQTPAQVSLSPKFCVARTQMSEFLARAGGATAERVVTNDLTSVIARSIDSVVLSGEVSTSTPYVPTGMSNTASINTVEIGTNGGALTLAHLRDMEYDLQSSNVEFDDTTCFIMHPRTWHGIQEFEMVQYSGQTSGGGFYFSAQPEKAVARSIFGYPVYLSTQVSITGTKGTGTAAGTALADVFFAKMSDVLLAEWGGISLKATDVGGDAWAKNMLEIKATAAVDVGVRHAQSICLISDSTT